MARQITMPEKVDEPTQAEINVMSAADTAEAIRAKLDEYKRKHGLQVAAGLGMMLLARSMVLLNESVATSEQHAALIRAAQGLYNAAVWHADREADADGLWTALRDAAQITPGFSPEPSSNSVFVVHPKHAATIQSTLDYLRQTDPITGDQSS